MAKAITYGLKRWPALTRFLDDGRLEVDNNIAKRVLRSVAIGRKNCLFAGSPSSPVLPQSTPSSRPPNSMALTRKLPRTDRHSAQPDDGGGEACEADDVD